MPVARSIGQRIRAGTHTAASLTTTYLITSLPVQADQNDSTPWIVNAALCTTPTPARITTNADLSRSPDGYYSWQIGFDYMTFGMTDHWNGTFIPGGGYSAPITIMDYNEENQAMFFTGEIWRPNYPSDKAQYIIGGWAKVIYDIRRGVQIFP
jgi:hypothetical protein